MAPSTPVTPTAPVASPPYVSVRRKVLALCNRALVQIGCSPAEIDALAPYLALSKNTAHGDYACSVAMMLAKQRQQPPRQIATDLSAALADGGGLLQQSLVAGPGFVNLFLKAQVWHQVLLDVLQQGASNYLRSDVGQQQAILLEYVSANPTGPLHVAHGRGAVIGDVLARLLQHTGFAVVREYYVNDIGKQIDVLAHSIFVRYCGLLGVEKPIPEDFYPGSYVLDLAKQMVTEFGGRLLEAPQETWLPLFKTRGATLMLQHICADLAAIGVTFDQFVHEKDIAQGTNWSNLLTSLREKNHLYEQEGKLWFRSTAFGDDKDRVVQREDGRLTYFASDMLYHVQKMERGYQGLINIWGADHDGYLPRIAASLAANGYDPKALQVLFIQMVALVRSGQTIKMGKRLGTAVWLRDVVDEVGPDAFRYLFLMRRNDAQMEFDLELAKAKTLDNPVFYAQMGHARLCSILAKAKAADIALPEPSLAVVSLLTLPEELGLLRLLAQAPDVLIDAALAREPHQIAFYVQQLIALFHSYYSRYKGSDSVLTSDVEKRSARLLLCMGLQQVLQQLLQLLGVSTPERMEPPNPSLVAGDDTPMAP